jgi:hypothetical protein
VCGEECDDFVADDDVVSTLAFDERVPVGWREVERGIENGLDPPALLGCHDSGGGVSSG